MIFAFSVPSHVSFCSDDNKSYLIQFAGPTIKIFLSVPLPLVSSLLATVKATGFAFFPWTSRVQRHHLPDHSSTQFFRVSQMIWNWFFCCFWMLLATFSIFHAICWDIFFPLANCSCALDIIFSSVLMLLAKKNSEISIFCNLRILVQMIYLPIRFKLLEATIYKHLCSFWFGVSQLPVSQGGRNFGYHYGLLYKHIYAV